MSTVTDWTPSDSDAPPPEEWAPPIDDLTHRRERRRTTTPDTPLICDTTAERYVLGAILQSRTALDDASRIITGADFADPHAATIWDTAIHLYSRGQPVEVLTVADALTSRGNRALERAGGLAHLFELTNEAAVPASAGHYAHIVRRYSLRRQLDATGARLRALAHDDTDTDPLARIDAALEHLQAIPRGVPGIDTEITDTWAPVALAETVQDVLAGTVTGPRATLLPRRDGKALLYPSAVHSISGEPGSAKTWFGLLAIAQDLAAGHPALMVDFEDRKETVVARLLALQVAPELITTGLRYVRPDVALNPASWAHLRAATEGCRVAVVDGITEAMTMHGLSLMDNEDAARWLALIPTRLADLGPAVLQVDHVVKSAETRGRYAIGAQHKLAGITGAAYTAIAVKAFGKGQRGQTRIVMQKDKHGDVGPNGMVVADLHLDATQPTPAGQHIAPIFAWLDAPEQSHDDDGNFRPTRMMGRVSEALERSPEGMSRNEIRMAVKGKNESIDLAIEALIREGNITTQNGPRGALIHTLNEPFQDQQ